MKKRYVAMALSLAMVFSTVCVPTMAYADATPENVVVTLGKDLTDEQKDTMYKFFGVNKDLVETIEVTNADERKFLEGVASDSVIGKRTYSCSCIQETPEGSGINVTIANLNWVTSYMISSALTTAGIYNCNVIAASPKEVSGTGALTGVMMAYEKVTGEELDEEKKELATEELVVTGTVAEEVGTDAATGIITEVKQEVIKEKIKDPEEIQEVIEEKSEKYQVTLSDEQVELIANTMVKVAEQKYDYEKVKGTFENITDTATSNLGIVTEKVEEAKGFFGTIGAFFAGIGKAIANFFKGIGNFFAGLFGGKDAKEENQATDDTEATEDMGILNNIDTSALGDDVIINSTDEELPNSTVDPNADKKEETEETAEETAEETTEESTAEETTEGSTAETTEETATEQPAATEAAE
ncbi:MAG: DUF1002 domain-containing protein [Lachnospiraceae bacterium]|nr:DUF1002 domain-containing protein [Lachnospiraceae bacterium]